MIYMTTNNGETNPSRVGVISRGLKRGGGRPRRELAIGLVGCFPRKTRYSTTITSTHTKLDLWRALP